jgi:hypothetical protein
VRVEQLGVLGVDVDAHQAHVVAHVPGELAMTKQLEDRPADLGGGVVGHAAISAAIRSVTSRGGCSQSSALAVPPHALHRSASTHQHGPHSSDSQAA